MGQGGVVGLEGGVLPASCGGEVCSSVGRQVGKSGGNEIVHHT